MTQEAVVAHILCMRLGSCVVVESDGVESGGGSSIVYELESVFSGGFQIGLA